MTEISEMIERAKRVVCDIRGKKRFVPADLLISDDIETIREFCKENKLLLESIGTSEKELKDIERTRVFCNAHQLLGEYIARRSYGIANKEDYKYALAQLSKFLMENSISIEEICDSKEIVKETNRVIQKKEK